MLPQWVTPLIIEDIERRYRDAFGNEEEDEEEEEFLGEDEEDE